MNHNLAQKLLGCSNQDSDADHLNAAYLQVWTSRVYLCASSVESNQLKRDAEGENLTRGGCWLFNQ